MAAIALHDFVERSVAYLFGDSLGDAVAERILSALRASETGLTRSEIREHFSRHLSREQTDAALRVLLDNGLADPTTEPTGGRPREIWSARKAPKAPNGTLTALSAPIAPSGKGEAWEGDE